MPKIEVHQDAFYNYLGTRMPEDTLEALLPVAKAELDEGVDENGIVKFELNDTNRPDLWSTAGLARQLRIYRGGSTPEYGFFSHPGAMQDAENRKVIVDPALQSVRPFIAAFGVTGKPIDEATLDDLIQTQEKLCWNFGRKREAIAMGVYRTDLMEYPVKYVAADPLKTRFVPLGMERELNLREIIAEHPKGQEYGGIVSGFSQMPFLTDSRDEVLSFPPIINSARIGAVETGDNNLFVELTGTDLPSLLLACSIVACDLADAGFTILPVQVDYPYDTPLGRSMVTPLYFQEPQTAEVTYIGRLLGQEISAGDAVGALSRMGVSAEAKERALEVMPPPYRNDFLHAVDIVEDVMIGMDMDTFKPEVPSDFTVGRLSAAEQFTRKVKSLMVGLGFQEMIFNYLGSGKEYVERMYPEGTWEDEAARLVRVANPISENYEFVRGSILPSLLAAESVSANAVYPHRIFETGKVCRVDGSDNYGSVTVNSVGFLSAETGADFNMVNSQVTALLYYVSATHTLVESADPRFIPGRAADIVVNGTTVGCFGEIHPAVLEKWGIQVPCAGGEANLDFLLSVR